MIDILICVATILNQIGDIQMDNFNIDQCILSYLSHSKYEKGLSFQTLKAYQIDHEQFGLFLKMR